MYFIKKSCYQKHFIKTYVLEGGGGGERRGEKGRNEGRNDNLDCLCQDYQSVFVTAQPLKIPLHNFYEFVWLLKTGLPRMFRLF